jgi:hypothetical protein
VCCIYQPPHVTGGVGAEHPAHDVKGVDARAGAAVQCTLATAPDHEVLACPLTVSHTISEQPRQISSDPVTARQDHEYAADLGGCSSKAEVEHVQPTPPAIKLCCTLAEAPAASVLKACPRPLRSGRKQPGWLLEDGGVAMPSRATRSWLGGGGAPALNPSSVDMDAMPACHPVLRTTATAHAFDVHVAATDPEVAGGTTSGRRPPQHDSYSSTFVAVAAVCHSAVAGSAGPLQHGGGCSAPQATQRGAGLSGGGTHVAPAACHASDVEAAVRGMATGGPNIDGVQALPTGDAQPLSGASAHDMGAAVLEGCTPATVAACQARQSSGTQGGDHPDRAAGAPGPAPRLPAQQPCPAATAATTRPPHAPAKRTRLPSLPLPPSRPRSARQFQQRLRILQQAALCSDSQAELMLLTAATAAARDGAHHTRTRVVRAPVRWAPELGCPKSTRPAVLSPRAACAVAATVLSSAPQLPGQAGAVACVPGCQASEPQLEALDGHALPVRDDNVGQNLGGNPQHERQGAAMPIAAVGKTCPDRRTGLVYVNGKAGVGWPSLAQQSRLPRGQFATVEIAPRMRGSSMPPALQRALERRLAKTGAQPRPGQGRTGACVARLSHRDGSCAAPPLRAQEVQPMPQPFPEGQQAPHPEQHSTVSSGSKLAGNSPAVLCVQQRPEPQALAPGSEPPKSSSAAAARVGVRVQTPWHNPSLPLIGSKARRSASVTQVIPVASGPAWCGP